MCGRYTLTAGGDVIRELFGLDGPIDLAPRYNIAPSQEVPVVREAPGGKRSLDRLRWGLVPAWQKEPPGSEARLINARSETAAGKPAFRDAFRRRRCLLPADGFFEWKRTGAGKRPYLIRLVDGNPFAFAGLWERWEGEEETAVESCTILTTEPNGLLADIHDRMPVILPPGAFPRWLDPGVDDSSGLGELLRPYPAEEMQARPVSKRVNNPRNDDPGCIEPFEPASPPQGDLFG